MTAETTARRPRKRRSVGSVIIGVIAELLLTVGIFILIFIGWQLWWTNIEAESVQQNAIAQVTQEWDKPQEDENGEPTQPIEGETWGILYIPKFGANYAKPIAEGISMDVLNTVGVGHYPQTQKIGEKGNVAFAGHRQTHGQVFWDMDKLTDGDTAYIQTKDGIYSYKLRQLQYVSPNQSDVLLPVPGQPGAEPEEKLMTLTTCHPPFSMAQRIISTFEQTDFAKRGEPIPAEIEEIVTKTTGGNG